MPSPSRAGVLAVAGIKKYFAEHDGEEKTAAEALFGVQLKQGISEKQEIIDELNQHGLPVIDLSTNDMARLHIRHMVGGRVLMGIQVPDADEKRFRAFLDSTGYSYVIEADNPAYRIFL